MLLTPSEIRLERRRARTPQGREQILADTLPRMQDLAGRLTRPGQLCEPGDLLSIGYLAAEHALGRWVPKPGVPFWAYAKAFVRAAMFRALSEASTPQPDSPVDPDVTVRPDEESNPYCDAIEALPTSQRRAIELRLLQSPPATEREAAKELGLTLPEFRALLWQALADLQTVRESI
jgi:RNA polymerase sigma factor (sigma-70 family)